MSAHYLSGLVHRFGSNHFDLVFAAYNAGPQAVSEYGGIPPFDETQRYVVKVMTAWQSLASMVHLPPDAYAVATSPEAQYWLDAQTR
jgi:soluble lytic murein transglycosylase-like protein